MLTPPLAWFVLLYLAALVVLRGLPGIIGRTVGMAAVTVTDAVVAFPFAYFMARVSVAQDQDGAVRGHPAAAVGELPGQAYSWLLIFTHRSPGSSSAR